MPKQAAIPWYAKDELNRVDVEGFGFWVKTTQDGVLMR